MKTPQKESKPNFQTELDRALADLSKLPIESQQYETAVKNIQILCTARAQKANDVPSMDAILTVGANILGILMVLNYEKANIVTTKAIGFIMKGRS